MPLVFLLLAGAIPVWGQKLALQTAAGGITISGNSPNYTSGFGAVNGLGVGTLPSGWSVITAGVAGGVLYVTPFNNVVSNVNSDLQVLSSYVQTNFNHPSQLILEICGPFSSCGNAANYTPISLSPATGTDYVTSPGVGNGTYTAYLGLFVSNADGAGLYTGSDSAKVVFGTFNSSNGHLNQTANLTLNSPNVNLQTAVQLSLATSGGGLTISPGSDFSAVFGNVNAMGIAPGAGLFVSSVSGGVVYGTPYLLQPAFSTFSSTTATLTAYVSADFGHPGILELRDAGTSGGPYSAVSKVSGSPTTLATSVSSGSAVIRYLGLFISNVNGGTSYRGADNATLTCTLTVP